MRVKILIAPVVQGLEPREVGEADMEVLPAPGEPVKFDDRPHLVMARGFTFEKDASGLSDYAVEYALLLAPARIA